MQTDNSTSETNQPTRSPSPQSSNSDALDALNQPASNDAATSEQTNTDENIRQQILLAEQRGYMRALGINPSHGDFSPVFLSNYNPVSFWD